MQDEQTTQAAVGGAAWRTLGDLEYATVRIGFSGAGRRLAAGSGLRGVRVMDTGTGQVVSCAETAHGPVALDATGAQLATRSPTV